MIAGCSVLYGLAAIGIALPALPWMLVLAMRFVCGLAIGGFTVGCPLYLSEIAPIAKRGRVVGVFQLQVGAGVIIAFSVGALSAHLAAGGSVWRLCLGLGALPAIVLLLLAQYMLKPALSDGPRDDDPTSEPSTSAPNGRLSKGRLFRRGNTRSLLLATSIAVFNQLSGVNVLLLYMLEILASAGLSFTTGHTYTVLISCLSFGTTILGMAFVDRLGRKPLLYVGSAGMALCLLALGLAIPHRVAPVFYLSILVAYNAFFAFSQGTVVWLYLSELFPPGIRGLGQGYGTSVHWIANAILISVFPTVQHISTVRIFYIFALMMALQSAVVWLWYPETRGTELGSFAVIDRAEEDELH